MPGVVTRYFDQELRLPGEVDAKGIASSRILFNLQTSKGSEKKLSPVPDDILLNKAFTSTLLYLYSFIQLYSGNLFRDNTAARARVGGGR